MNAIKGINTTHMTNVAHIGYMEQTIKRAKENETASEGASSQVGGDGEIHKDCEIDAKKIIGNYGLVSRKCLFWLERQALSRGKTTGFGTT